MAFNVENRMALAWPVFKIKYGSAKMQGGNKKEASLRHLFPCLAPAFSAKPRAKPLLSENSMHLASSRTDANVFKL